MTRATVGGINSEDNLWYPLAVNSQGIAQIDTSGIPQPLEWQSEEFQPSYGSTSGDFAAAIDYDRQYGRIWWLGKMAWIKILLRTDQVVITNPRGELTITGTPYPFRSSLSYGAFTGASLSNFKGFSSGIDVRTPWFMHTGQEFRLQKFEAGELTAMVPSDLLEGSNSACNAINISYWGELLSIPGTRTPELDLDLLHEKLETEADTP